MMRWRPQTPLCRRDFIVMELMPSGKPITEGAGVRARGDFMRIEQHDKSHIVELEDGSRWQIWPGDIATTLQWLPTTELQISAIDDELCSHALIDREGGSRVRVIEASAAWPVAEVRQSLKEG
jgi:hypothetical protein